MTGKRRRLLVATGSKHKLAELRALLALPASDLVALADIGLEDDAEEVGQSFEQNATAKALWYAAKSRLPTVADDSGLEVDALGGRPGVHTRRFAGENPTDEQNNAHLLRLLGAVPATDRGARYRCVLAYAEPTDEGGSTLLETAVGTMEGRITAQGPCGSGGFGYDPIFEPAEEPVGGRTVAQLSADEKNARSHRGHAARVMRELLIARGY
ncbi:MAG: non-canonical purine NTP pyrophosphatase [Chloroflexota bacterium]|nr:non-canonical purine NTP pyrophosphatase [Chloroflexota bacterium]